MAAASPQDSNNGRTQKRISVLQSVVLKVNGFLAWCQDFSPEPPSVGAGLKPAPTRVLIVKVGQKLAVKGYR
jgi:hypothetical protein